MPGENSHVWSTGGAQNTVSRIWRGVPSGAAEGTMFEPRAAMCHCQGRQQLPWQWNGKTFSCMHQAEAKHALGTSPLRPCWLQVPKMLGSLRHMWAPEAFLVSFKLETDEGLLISKVHIL